MRFPVVVVMTAFFIVPSLRAETINPSLYLNASRPIHDSWQSGWPSCSDEHRAVAAPAPRMFTVGVFEHADAQPLHAAAVEHSDAYQTRAKIHKYSSFATLPLFAAEVALGQSIYNTPANLDARKTAHVVVGTAIIGLFGVNTVTGAWNLFGEGRRDKEGRTLRLVHGLLMMASDAGFLATTLSGPNSHSPRQALTFESNKVRHRNLAIASISVGTAGYLLMLFGNH